MTLEQIRWAATHDWFAWGGESFVQVHDSDAPTGYRTFSDYKALREWAGY